MAALGTGRAALLVGLMTVTLAACGQAPADSARAPSAPPAAQPTASVARVAVTDTAPVPDDVGPVVRSTGASLTQVVERSRWPLDKNQIVEILWEDLLPPGAEEAYIAQMEAHMQSLYDLDRPIIEGGAGDDMIQFGTFDTVPELADRRIRIPGYAVPFDFSRNAEIKEFLLVPYFGACIHSPPPPPNQMIYVRMNRAFRLGDLAQAVWVEGTLRTAAAYNDLGNTAYTLEATKFERYPMPGGR